MSVLACASAPRRIWMLSSIFLEVPVVATQIAYVLSGCSTATDLANVLLALKPVMHAGLQFVQNARMFSDH